jgi:threonine/homoserine/homoserine lactone efflux protein
LARSCPTPSGVAISPIPIIAIILMLVTPKAKSNGSAFAIGWVLGLAVVPTIVLILAAGSNHSTSSGPTRTVSIIKLVLGVLLMVPAARQWRGRPKPGESPKMPKWMEAIDKFTVAKALGTGVLLSALNPKNLALSIATGLSIAQASFSTGEQVGVVIIYVALGSLTVLARATRRLPDDAGPRSQAPRRLAHLA